MSVNKSSIEEKLKRLEETTAILEQYKKIAQRDFSKDYTINGAARHYLVLGIGIIIDIGSHILAGGYQIRTEHYAESIEKLGEVGVISEKFAKKNLTMAGFRNLLIHDYIKVDMEKVYGYLQEAPGIFRKFAKAYQSFLDEI